MIKSSEFHEPVVTRRLAFSLDVEQARRLHDDRATARPEERPASTYRRKVEEEEVRTEPEEGA
jgi:hypothetical protein